MSDRDNIREEVKKDIENKMGVLIHLVVYLLVNAFLYISAIVTRDGVTELPIVSIGWGFGLSIHFIKVFFLNNNFIERRVDERMKNI